MAGTLIELTKDNIDREHICCAISDKKCHEGYLAKKEWLKERFSEGYVFRRLDERAKVFMEYGPAEMGWAPIHAPNYLLINCFWVSGKYKGQGHGKALLEAALQDAIQNGKDGLVTVAGKSKFHFMSDAKWLLKHGFEIVEEGPAGFVLLVYKINQRAALPAFRECVSEKNFPTQPGLVAFYSHRCPFAEFHVTQSLTQSAHKRGIPLTIQRLETTVQAQSIPIPASIFSLFYNGRFITTDVSACMDERFDKYIKV